ncbi:MAG: histidine phosphatase family protein, partial [Chloroflexota bacterium]
IVAEARNTPFVSDARLNEYHDETFDEMKARVKDFLDSLQEQPYQQVMICSHGMIIAALTNFITKGSFELANQNDYPPPGELFIIRDKKVDKISP